jgi:heterodisulfide reductase subunit C
MINWRVRRRVKYEAELDPSFPREICSIPNGENLLTCIQCGTCSSTCPLSIYMDYTPRRIIAMTRAGFKSEVLRTFTIWLCSSCYACTVECPRQIKITDLMYALKQRAIKEGVYPRRFGIPVLAREFYKVVQKHGRNNEGQVILNLVFKTNPFQHLKKAVMGIKLWFLGRISLKRDRIKNREELQKILEAVAESVTATKPETTPAA